MVGLKGNIKRETTAVSQHGEGRFQSLPSAADTDRCAGKRSVASRGICHCSGGNFGKGEDILLQQVRTSQVFKRGKDDEGCAENSS